MNRFYGCNNYHIMLHTNSMMGSLNHFSNWYIQSYTLRYIKWISIKTLIISWFVINFNLRTFIVSRWDELISYFYHNEGRKHMRSTLLECIANSTSFVLKRSANLRNKSSHSWTKSINPTSFYRIPLAYKTITRVVISTG